MRSSSPSVRASRCGSGSSQSRSRSRRRRDKRPPIRMADEPDDVATGHWGGQPKAWYRSYPESLFLAPPEIHRQSRRNQRFINDLGTMNLVNYEHCASISHCYTCNKCDSAGKALIQRRWGNTRGGLSYRPKRTKVAFAISSTRSTGETSPQSMSGLPRQFWLMYENSRCSILFHLLVPGGR